ncbi:MAG: HRDC domain-containing protein [Acidimicrobiales bacterium]
MTEKATGPEIVADAGRLEEVIDTAVAHPAYAIDTEFHRERTYYPKLALVQLAWPGGLVVIDPLAVDVAALGRLLADGGVAVLHACSQDLEVLERVTGETPADLFDTQVAAGFVGLRSPSLAALHDQLLGRRLPKGDRLTDWLRRPLSDDQLEYAAADVRHLLEIHAELVTQLTDRGRLEWARTECEIVLAKDRSGRDPDEAWRRVKEARQLRGRNRAIVRALAAWRERRAAELDIPVRYVLPDLALVSIAQRPPRDVAALSGVRGLDDRHLKGGTAEALLATIAEVDDEPAAAEEDPPQRSLPRDLRPAVSLVASWITQIAADNDLDPALVGSRGDVEGLLRGDEDARLSMGWRADLVGAPIRRLVAGDAALAFDGQRRLVLEERSRRRLGDAGRSDAGIG